MSQIRAARLSDRSSVIGLLFPFYGFPLPYHPARLYFSSSQEKKWMISISTNPFTFCCFSGHTFCHFYRLCTIGISILIEIWSRDCDVCSETDLIYQANKYRQNSTIMELFLGTIWMVLKKQYHFQFQPFPKPFSFRNKLSDIFVKFLLTT